MTALARTACVIVLAIMFFGISQSELQWPNKAVAAQPATQPSDLIYVYALDHGKKVYLCATKLAITAPVLHCEEGDLLISEAIYPRLIPSTFKFKEE